jgi:hypothetical protein
MSVLTAATLAVAHAIAAKFPWQDYATILDVGTAEGCLPVQVLQRHPHLTGTGFDLPPLAPLFDAYVERHALSSRLREASSATRFRGLKCWSWAGFCITGI